MCPDQIRGVLRKTDKSSVVFGALYFLLCIFFHSVSIANCFPDNPKANFNNADTATTSGIHT